MLKAFSFLKRSNKLVRRCFGPFVIEKGVIKFTGFFYRNSYSFMVYRKPFHKLGLARKLHVGRFWKNIKNIQMALRLKTPIFYQWKYWIQSLVDFKNRLKSISYYGTLDQNNVESFRKLIATVPYTNLGLWGDKKLSPRQLTALAHRKLTVHKTTLWTLLVNNQVIEKEIVVSQAHKLFIRLTIDRLVVATAYFIVSWSLAKGTSWRFVKPHLIVASDGISSIRKNAEGLTGFSENIWGTVLTRQQMDSVLDSLAAGDLKPLLRLDKVYGTNLSGKNPLP
jgi:hypothetical protein